MSSEALGVGVGWAGIARRGRALLALALLLLPARSHAFENVSQGAIVDVGGGTSGVGDFLLAELGVQSVGLLSLADERWLLQWDGLFAPKAGVLANQLPYTTLFGGHVRAFGEAGRRFEPERISSFYLGLRLSGDVQILLPTGHGLGGLAEFNNVSGIGDFGVSGAARVAAGWSHLGEGHSLLLTAYVEELGVGAETNMNGAAYTNFGAAVRFDLPQRLTLSGEGAWGRTPTQGLSSLGLSGYDSLISSTVSARYVFHNGMWLGFTWAVTLLEESSRYQGGLSYSTVSAPTVTTTLVYGFPLGKQAFP